MANEAKMVYATTATTVISLAGDGLVDAEVTYDALSNLTQLNLDNSVLNYPLATATFYTANGWQTSAPTDGSTFDLYMVRYDTDGTDDDTPLPITTDLQGAEYVGSFSVSNQTYTAAYRKTITISLAGVKTARFYVMNNTGKTVEYTATPITVKVLPFTYGPA
jgi:hypothetical protein